MAFELGNFSRQSVALNTGEVTVNGVAVGGPAIFTYRSAVDTILQVSTANYFASQVVNLSENDFIKGVASDGPFEVYVTAVDRVAKTITVANT